MNLLRTSIFCTLALILTTRAVLAEYPRVLVSVNPVHSLIAQITQGVGAPDLLLAGTVSPHTYSMRPSDSRKLHAADVVFWVGPALETFLVKPLSTLDSNTHIVELNKQPNINTIKSRSSHFHDDENQTHSGLEFDPHIWLDPNNAKSIVKIATNVLSKIDPGNQSVYQANSDNAIAQLTALEKEINERLKPVMEIPYIVFHDAYQHFEKHYGLNSLAAVTIGAEKMPGAKGIIELKKLIVENDVKCMFSEPQFEPKILETITEDVDIEIGTLDSLGATIEPGVSAYEQILLGLTTSLTSCLSNTH